MQYKSYQYDTLVNDKPWRLVALEELGVVWETRASLWDDRYKELLGYKSLHGDCMVPTKSKSKEYKILGMWVTTQKNKMLKFTRGGMSQLNDERIKMLNHVGFVWSVTNYQWREMYDRYCEYVNSGEKSGGWEEDKEVCGWVEKQRVEYAKMMSDKDGMDHERDSMGRLRSGRMTEERFRLLNDVGFEW
jgi:hypothetical protein